MDAERRRVSLASKEQREKLRLGLEECLAEKDEYIPGSGMENCRLDSLPSGHVAKGDGDSNGGGVA